MSLLGACVTSSLQAFAAYYLKVEAGLAPSRILLLTAVYFGGAIVGTWGIRRSIDRIHVRRFFQAAVILTGAVELYWLAYVSGVVDLVYRDPESGEVVVADYKTDRIDDPDAEEARERMEAYRRQGAVYRRALREGLGLDYTPRFELWLLAADTVRPC